MTPLFAKLNLKSQQTIVVMNAPESFESELAALSKSGAVRVARDIAKSDRVEFAIAFAVTQKELDTVSELLARKTEGDAVVWIAYPKISSRRYKCEFNRDSGWRVLTAAGFETVRQVAIDEDWSALRFRRTQYVKSGRKPAAHPA